MKAKAFFTLGLLLAMIGLVGNCHAGAFIVWGTGEDGPGTGGAKDDAGDYLPGTRALGPIDFANGALVQLWKAVNDVDDPRGVPEASDPDWRIDDELLDEAHVGYGLVPPGSPGDGEFSRRTACVNIKVGDVVYARIYNLAKPDLAGPMPGGCEVGISGTRTVTDPFSESHPGRRYYFDNVQTEVLIPPPCVPPVADAGDDLTVEQEGCEGTEVVLDGSGSTDPDSTPGTNDDIVSFDWYEGDSLLGSGEIIAYTFPPGTHTVTLVVTDSCGASDDDDVIVTVQDTTPPSIVSVSATPNVLWPPNHKMVEVVVTVEAVDVSDPAPVCYIVDVTSNEPIDGPGDGDTEADWEITGELTVNLRAERAGVGTGRIYTLHIECTDASGNTATATVTVTVPHDMGGGKK